VTDALSTIDQAHFRQVLGHFATGVTVIAAHDEQGPIGFTCQSFMSLSLDPALVAFAPGKASSTWPRIRATGVFCANVLAEDQEDVCRVFASKGGDKFQGIGWRPGVTGSPVLADVLAWVEARIEAVHDAGDHEIVIGRVAELGVREAGHPLLFYRGGFGRFEA